MADTSKSLATIEDNCKIALANCGDWIKPADTAAIASLLRLARLCDALFDSGETKDLAPLMSRLHSIMDSLHMTPKSRSDQPVTDTKVEPDVKSLSEAYLRIVQTPGGDVAPKRPKPRTPSGSNDGDGKRATT
jgi:hypothetical protein